MKHIIRLVIIFVVCVSVMACQGQVGQTTIDIGTETLLESDVGSVANNPKLPSKAIKMFPSFDDYIYNMDFALDYEKLLSLETQNSRWQQPASQKIKLETKSLASILIEFKLLEIYSKQFAETAAEMGVQEITDTPLTVKVLDVPEGFIANELIKNMNEVEVSLDTLGSDLRFVFKSNNEETGVYIVSFNEKGVPVRGFLSFVNPLDHDGSGDFEKNIKRTLLMAFDYSNEESLLTLVQSEIYNSKTDSYISTWTSFDCNSVLKTCVSEYGDILSKEKVLSDNSMRFAWTSDSAGFCVAPVSYIDGIQIVSSGKTRDEDAGLIDCEMPESHWDGFVLTEEVFLDRVHDTEPFGGTAYELLNGGFDLITDATIDKWLFDLTY